jgi:hypothetical protein
MFAMVTFAILSALCFFGLIVCSCLIAFFDGFGKKVELAMTAIVFLFGMIFFGDRGKELDVDFSCTCQAQSVEVVEKILEENH